MSCKCICFLFLAQVKDSVIPANAPALRITTSTQSPTTSKPKPGRMKLSDRFNEFHNEAKRKKLEEGRVDEENDRLSEKQPGKGKGTTFTIQVPRKQSSTKSTNVEEIQKVTTQPKVTLVPGMLYSFFTHGHRFLANNRLNDKGYL